MALSFEEAVPAGRTISKIMAEDRVHQLKSLQQEALKVSNLIADPNWQVFVSHAERIQREKEAQAKVIKERLDSKVWGSTDYANLVVDFTKADCTAKGIAMTLQIAKTIVELGERAATELTGISGDVNVQEAAPRRQ